MSEVPWNNFLDEGFNIVPLMRLCNGVPAKIDTIISEFGGDRFRNISYFFFFKKIEAGF